MNNTIKSFSQFLKEKEEKTQEIFVDLDGVLADFATAMNNLGEFSTDDEMWAAIRNSDGFFENLNFQSGAKELWEFVSRYNPSILSSAPRRVPSAKSEKIDWVKSNLYNYNEIIIVDSKKDKAKWAQKDGVSNILIDDTKEVIDYWVEAGGIGIHHKNVNTTIENIKQFGY